MKSKFLWHNFRDSRHLNGEDERVDGNIRRNRLEGPSSPLPSKRDSSREPSAREVERAKEEAVGGKRDECKKGEVLQRYLHIL